LQRGRGHGVSFALLFVSWDGSSGHLHFEK
jgi:hypothetical protein